MVPFSYLVALVFLALILYSHITAVSHLKINQKGVFSDEENGKIGKLFLVIRWGYWVFFDFKWFTKIGDFLSDLHAKLYYVVYPIKIAILILYLVMYAFYLDNPFSIVSYILCFIAMTIISFYRIRSLNIVTEMWGLIAYITLACQWNLFDFSGLSKRICLFCWWDFKWVICVLVISFGKCIKKIRWCKWRNKTNKNKIDPEIQRSKLNFKYFNT